MTRLTLVVPVRDVAPYIAPCLTSLARNVGHDDQVILVDDASSDDTPEIVESFRGRVPGLEVVRNAQAHGLAGARNDGLDRAEGRYIAFLDGDDWLAPGTLDGMVHAIERLGVDFVRVDHVKVLDKRRVVSRAPEGRRNRPLDPRSSINPATETTMVDYAYAWAGVFDRRLLDGGLLRFDSGLHTAEDRPWVWRLHRRAESYGVASVLGHMYRRGVSSSLTQIGDRRQLDYIRSFEIVLAEAAADPEADVLLPKALRSYFSVMAHHLRHEKRMTAGLRHEHHRLARQSLRRVDAGLRASVLSGMGRRGRALDLLRLGLPNVMRMPL
ncbi:MAG: glycosyltransferase family 2 protein [Actinomycetes bacterium]